MLKLLEPLVSADERRIRDLAAKVAELRPRQRCLGSDSSDLSDRLEAARAELAVVRVQLARAASKNSGGG